MRMIIDLWVESSVLDALSFCRCEGIIRAVIWLVEEYQCANDAEQCEDDSHCECELVACRLDDECLASASQEDLSTGKSDGRKDRDTEGAADLVRGFLNFRSNSVITLAAIPARRPLAQSPTIAAFAYRMRSIPVYSILTTVANTSLCD